VKHGPDNAKRVEAEAAAKASNLETATDAEVEAALTQSTDADSTESSTSPKKKAGKPAHAAPEEPAEKKSGIGKKLALGLCALALCGGGVALALNPGVISKTRTALSALAPQIGSQEEAELATEHDTDLDEVTDTKELSAEEIAEQEAQAALDERAKTGVPTRQVAEYKDIAIYSPIRNQDLTCVLFHQASFDYALKMSTELDEANNEKAMDKHKTRINTEQDDDEEWLDAEALHCYRSYYSTEIDTALDVGAKAGCVVYAPVTGTVVNIRKYELTSKIKDYELHIQPKDHADLDLVVIHIDELSVEEGDEVEAGVTPVAVVRDIDSYMDGIQMSEYVPKGTGGNHAHLAINNANAKYYRAKKLNDGLHLNWTEKQEKQVKKDLKKLEEEEKEKEKEEE